LKSGRVYLLLLLLLASLSVWVLPATDAAAPEVLKTFSGTLAPGDIATTPGNWQLDRNIPEPGFLFHYAITGGSDPNDVIYVYIEETDDAWDYLMGEGWTYCSQTAVLPCSLDADSYTVTVEADQLATRSISYAIEFYLPTEPSAEFSGQMPANSDARLSSFGMVFPRTTSGQLVVGVTSGRYEFFVDGEPVGDGQPITTTTELPVSFDSCDLPVLGQDVCFHMFEVSAELEGLEENVAWFVQVPPILNVEILSECPTLNPETGESVCITGAQATASDGGTPAVSYLWTASGGSFNSTTSQWVEWTAPPGFSVFTLTAQATAPGYFSGSKTFPVQVVPEFSPAAVPFVIAIALAFVLLSRKSRRRSIA